MNIQPYGFFYQHILIEDHKKWNMLITFPPTREALSALDELFHDISIVTFKVIKQNMRDTSWRR